MKINSFGIVMISTYQKQNLIIKFIQKEVIFSWNPKNR